MMNVIEKCKVSRETVDRLKTYQQLVLEWNHRFNLISKQSEAVIWERHILDSLQLCEYIKAQDEILLDLGAGAGFPGIVIAIAAKQLFPKLTIHLVESIAKKVSFLNMVKDTLELNVIVHHDRIENIKLKNVDIITSRALASLPKLLEYSIPFCNKNTKMLFLKGGKWESEVREALQLRNFEFTAISSQTDEKGKILYINKLGDEV